ncbi:hypothetical protein ABBQ38_004141 [Trebouxia sp. C0009 RCD-2024]
MALSMHLNHTVSSDTLLRVHSASCSLSARSRLQPRPPFLCRRKVTTRCSAQSPSQADETLRAKRKISIEDLHNPAHIGGSAKSEVSVQDFGSDLSLDAYMQLPVEQYYELDPTMIWPLEGNRFALKVPRVNLFNVWVEPLVEVTVHLSDQRDAVVIQATNCQISGSDLIENLHLDQRFCLSFKVTLTWDSAQESAQNGSKRSNTPQQIGMGHIQGDLKLDVWSEVIQPFNLMPRFALEGTSNAVMNALVTGLLPKFMDRLGDDYKRWATDPNYRQARKAATKQESLPK